MVGDGDNTGGAGAAEIEGDGSPTNSSGAPLADSTNDGEGTVIGAIGGEKQPVPGDEGAARSDQSPAADAGDNTGGSADTSQPPAPPAPPDAPSSPPAAAPAVVEDKTTAQPSGDAQPPKAGDIDPLTGDKLVKVNLKNSIGLNGMPLYGPGRGILVPERIARAAGWDAKKAEELEESERQQKERDQYVDGR